MPAPIHDLEPVTSDHWPQSRAYLYGIDLFNTGFAWEAHEVWEDLWRLSESQSADGCCLSGLIKLCAAAVKASAGNTRGVARHRDKAARALAPLQAPIVLGLPIPSLQKEIAAIDPQKAANRGGLGIYLMPGHDPEHASN